jgi:hypothetical protein
MMPFLHVFGVKNPSPTPPHKGEGLTMPRSLHNATPYQRMTRLNEAQQINGQSPSPLWGGVGERF